MAAAVVLVYSTVVVSVQVPPVNLDSELMIADLRGEVALGWGVAGGSRGLCSVRTEKSDSLGAHLGSAISLGAHLGSAISLGPHLGSAISLR